MIVWGADLGVRSVYLCRIENGEASHASYIIKKPKDRWEELTEISVAVSKIVGSDLLGGDILYVEEPVVAGVRNLRTSLKIAQNAGSVFAGSSIPATFVPVSSWKKQIIGKGNAKKEEIAQFLKENHYEMWANCNEDQNLIDATCVALYGVSECQKNG